MLLRYGTHTPRKKMYKLDIIQRRAARYTCNRWHNISSATEMVGHLGWEPLAKRRRNMRLCMMYKIAHTVVGDPWAEWLTRTKRVTRGFHAWKCIPIYSQHCHMLLILCCHPADYTCNSSYNLPIIELAMCVCMCVCITCVR